MHDDETVENSSSLLQMIDVLFYLLQCMHSFLCANETNFLNGIANALSFLSDRSSKKAVTDVQGQGKICVLDIDMQGVRSMKETDLKPVYVFIKPPSIKELVGKKK